MDGNTAAVSDPEQSTSKHIKHYIKVERAKEQ